ncbi:MAG: V-type ATPase subunit, partial [Candidatus Marsarchaeota archaeon]|nr:V-type ATPase subunit [Candidatus Marsarchaeota archaeon]
MDASYTGSYGRLRVLRPEFLSNAFIDGLLEKKSEDEIVKAFVATSYRKDIDAFSGLYKPPDLFEVVINAHMLGMIRDAITALPQSAKAFIRAYMSKWDIENIKTILSSKLLGYDVEHTEAFLTVERGIPVGTLSGVITREDYINMITQKSIDDVIAHLVRYGYGTILLKHIDEMKSKGDITTTIADLDVYYYANLLSAFRFYSGDETTMLSYIRELIDVKNITMAVKAIDMKQSLQGLMIKGGKIPEAKLDEIATKGISVLKANIPYHIDSAIDAFNADPSMSYLEAALMRELYKKYLGVFEKGMGLEFIFAFILKSELERNELRTVLYGKHYNIKNDKIEKLRILKSLR